MATPAPAPGSTQIPPATTITSFSCPSSLSHDIQLNTNGNRIHHEAIMTQAPALALGQPSHPIRGNYYVRLVKTVKSRHGFQERFFRGLNGNEDEKTAMEDVVLKCKPHVMYVPGPMQVSAYRLIECREHQAKVEIMVY
jgi:hypothetical protein